MKRNIIIIGVVVILVLAVAAILGLQQMNARAAASARVPTTAVQRGSLVATVDAAGNVSAPQDATLAFQTTGRVSKVSVQLGDQVKAGQVLMELDTTDLQLALKAAQASLASAQANFDASQNNLQGALKTAQANLASAQANYDSTKSKNEQGPNQLIVAKAALDKAASALQQAQAAYDRVGGATNPSIGMMPQSVTLQQATDDYKSALATYEITAAGIDDTALRAAQAQVDTAQVAVDQAQHNLDTSLRVAQAALDSATVARDQAQSNLDKAKILAPFDGLIAAVNYDLGDTTGSASAISVANPSQLQVKVTVAEVDMARLKVGDTAQMTLDALPGQTYTGTVIAIGPVGTITQGVVNYPVTAEVTGTKTAVRPGMTANLSIVVDRRDNVLMIPLRAVRTQGNQKVVTVLYKGQQIQAPVTLGLQNDTMAEVTSGLQEGDEVVTSVTTTRQPSGGGGIPFLGGGGGFGGR